MIKKVLVASSLILSLSAYACPNHSMDFKVTKEMVKSMVDKGVEKSDKLPKKMPSINNKIDGVYFSKFEKISDTAAKATFELPEEFNDKTADSPFENTTLQNYLTDFVVETQCGFWKRAYIKAGMQATTTFKTKTGTHILSLTPTMEICEKQDKKALAQHKKDLAH